MAGSTIPPHGQSEALDARRLFVSRRGAGRLMNVPETDERVLCDTASEHGCRRALEIGTCAVGIAWALAKTGGRLLHIEIAPDRYRSAVDNFRAAGLSECIDARLGEAHGIVPALEGASISCSAVRSRAGIETTCTRYCLR